MNSLEKLRDISVLQGLSRRLQSIRLSRQIVLMEVCGTHTMAIHHAGLPSLFPHNLKVLSGPGCPVCVTPSSYLDTAMSMASEHGVILATFGDMIRVPGNSGSLSELRRDGYPVEIVYSPLGAVDLAQGKPDSQVVFLAVGFETTAPTVAASIKYAREKRIKNFSILSAHKLIIPALELLIADPGINIDGFILPGHVSVVIGREPYRFIAEKFSRACVITGFETADIIQGILMLIEQIEKQKYEVEIQYRRAVRPEGNVHARAVIDEVFMPADSIWRGFGTIPSSGLVLREAFAEFDAERRFPVNIEEFPEPENCLCGEVLRGTVEPPECSLFAKACIPEKPVGPCMVSTEGTCAAFYRYSRKS